MEDIKMVLSANMEWVNLVLGLIGGGFVGFRIGIKKSVKQSQKSGDNSNNIQIGGDFNGR